MTVLFIDDQDAFRYILKRAFSKIPEINFESFKYSEDFLERLDEILTDLIPDLIIIDLNLKGSEIDCGVTLFNELKKRGVLNNRVVGFYSTSKEEIKAAKKLKANFYCLKSLSADQFVIRIIEDLKGHKERSLPFKIYQ